LMPSASSASSVDGGGLKVQASGLFGSA